MNKILLSGRLTRDVELRTTESGKSVANIDLAVQREFKNANGEYDTDFINCSLWNKTAEIANMYCKKGSKIIVEGSIRHESYEDNEGNTKYKTYVLANRIELLDSKKDMESAMPFSVEAPTEPFTNGFSSVGISDDDLPF